MASNDIKTLQEVVRIMRGDVEVLKEEIHTIAGGGYIPAGSVFFTDLPALSDARYGFVYNIKDSFTTTSDFIEGAGHTYSAGTNVGIVKNELGQLKYDVFSAFVDLADIYSRIDARQTINLSKEIAGATTVEGALEALSHSGGITVDTELSTTSVNPVQNKVITSALNNKLNKDDKAASATSADYAERAKNDGAGNEIAKTYLTAYAASLAYLGKNEKASDSLKADTATSAINDADGNNIVNTYLTKLQAANTYATKQEIEYVQYGTMPSASADNVGQVIQYIGATYQNYTHGYFYECINDNGTYKWQNINVQPGGSGGTGNYPDLTNKPQINGVELVGNLSANDIGVVGGYVYDAASESATIRT